MTTERDKRLKKRVLVGVLSENTVGGLIVEANKAKDYTFLVSTICENYTNDTEEMVSVVCVKRET